MRLSLLGCGTWEFTVPGSRFSVLFGTLKEGEAP